MSVVDAGLLVITAALLSLFTNSERVNFRTECSKSVKKESELEIGEGSRDGGGYRLAIEHPLLDWSQGFIPGTRFVVRLTGSDVKTFDGYVIQSWMNGNAVGQFTDLPAGAKLCGGAGVESLKFGHLYSLINLTWAAEANVRGTCVDFQASVRSGDKWTRVNESACKRKDCFLSITNRSGVLSNEILANPTFQNCPFVDVIFQRPKQDQIFLQFRDFKMVKTNGDTYCEDPFVSICTSLDAPLKHLCGIEFPSEALIADGDALVMRFKRLNNNSSFNALYYTLDKRKGCNETVTSSIGSVTSPNFPWPYYPDLDCYTLIKVPSGQETVLQLRTFLLQGPLAKGDGKNCDADFLEAKANDQTLFKICGHMKPLPDITVTQDVVLHFHSDHLIEDKGFDVFFRPAKDACAGQRLLTEPKGLVYDAALSSADGVAVGCFQKVQVPFGYGIQINVTLDGNFDNVSELLVKSGSSRRQTNCSLTSVPLLEIRNNETVWRKCLVSNAVYVFSGNVVDVRLARGPQNVRVSYRALPVNRSLTECEYGWISGELFCYFLEGSQALPWEEAEEACKILGGHLASVANVQVQGLLEDIIRASLLNTSDVSVWIGGNDRAYENCYEWADGRPFTYANWFPGWPTSNFYNSQPSDDGLANQDCVEMRREFRYATKGLGLTDAFYWNDRDCRVRNPYVCEKLRPGVTLDPYPPNCNRSVVLSTDRRRDTFTSPSHPDPYPHNMDCFIIIHAPPSHKIILTFSAFSLEDELECRYDYLEISEPLVGLKQRRCGDWSGRLKLLRVVTKTNILHLAFKSDYSHSFAGFKAEVALDQGEEVCDDPRLSPYGNNCYLLVSYPEVTWYTAKKICREMQGILTSVSSQSEQNFLMERIQKTETSTSGTLFWLGGFRKSSEHPWLWIDGSLFNYTDWYPGWMKERNELVPKQGEASSDESCLASQWKSIKDSNGRSKTTGLYWESQSCDQSGGYICKKEHTHGTKPNLNRTIAGLKGNLTSPNHPFSYPNNLDYTVHIIGPVQSRILVQFTHLDLEWQEDCLYDYIALRSDPDATATRLCGQHSTNLNAYDFVSNTNELYANFHSDYSIAGSGFDAVWTAVDTSACPTRLTNFPSGTVQSINFPHGYISNLDCLTIIVAAPGSRIWLEFIRFDVGSATKDGKCNNDYLRVIVGTENKEFVTLCGNRTADVAKLTFLSLGNELHLNFHSDDSKPHGGYLATFKTVDQLEETVVFRLVENSTGNLPNLNHPLATPPNVNLSRKLMAPVGSIVAVLVSQAKHEAEVNASCPAGTIEVEDRFSKKQALRSVTLCALENSALAEEVNVVSTFNTIYIREITGGKEMIGFEVSYAVRKDPNFMDKSRLPASIKYGVDSCSPNPCLNNGDCQEMESRAKCHCRGHFTGLFCHVTKCDPNPCANGKCNLTRDGFSCICNKPYSGNLCNEVVGSCTANPCGNRGVCVEINDTITCQCHTWWEGARCQHRIFPIPYKPLSRRMLREPFWLGLITVSVVLLVLGCVWCIKRKFADKLERFLSEEIERNQQRGRSSSLHKLGKLAASREQVATASVLGSPQPTSRSLFSRLGRRKQSVLNLEVGSKSRRYHENRSFSFDDLLRKGSPRRRSHVVIGSGSAGGSRDEEATKEILQALVSPVPKLHRRMSLEEFIHLSEQKMKAVQDLNNSTQTLSTDETSFSNPPTLPTLQSKQSKMLKKKVSFAKCLESAAEAIAAQTSASEHTESEVQGGTSSSSSCLSQFCSDTEDATSGDDVSLDVPSFISSTTTATTTSSSSSSSGSCSSSESTSSSTSSPLQRGTRNSRDEKFSSPVVVIHQPPPDSPPHCPTCKSPLSKELPSDVVVDIGLQERKLDVVNRLSGDAIVTIISDNKTCNDDLQSGFRREMNDCVDGKVHAIDDLAEALEKRKMDEMKTTSHRLQIPIFAVYDTTSGQPVRKASLDGAMLRIPDSFPRRLSVDAAAMAPQMSKSPIGGLHEMASTATKQRPPPLQIPKLIQLETSPSARRGPRTKCVLNPFSASTGNSEKPNSLDLPTPPIITITSSVSSGCDSDTDSPIKVASGMQYLSPYVLLGPTADDMSTSLSNLSSSGYSSMTSPVPSRCGSSNPLFPPSDGDQEPPLTPRSHLGFKPFAPFTKSGLLCPMAALHRPRNPYLWSGGVERPSSGSPSSREVSPPSGKSSPSPRKQSSSETADELDEGIGMEGQTATVEKYKGETNNTTDRPNPSLEVPVKDPGPGGGLLTPLIVVQAGDGSDLFWQNLRRPSFEHTLSPVSSRSESPVSERGEHFSPQFYGSPQQQPGTPDTLAPPMFTDSDCCTGSELAVVKTNKRQGRRRERPHTAKRKLSPGVQARSSTAKRASPKRRSRGGPLGRDPDTSSSSESISSHSAKDSLLGGRSSPKLDQITGRLPHRKRFQQGRETTDRNRTSKGTNRAMPVGEPLLSPSFNSKSEVGSSNCEKKVLTLTDSVDSPCESTESSSDPDVSVTDGESLINPVRENSPTLVAKAKNRKATVSQMESDRCPEQSARLLAANKDPKSTSSGEDAALD